MFRLLAILVCVLALVGCQSASGCDFGFGAGFGGYGGGFSAGYGVQSFGAFGAPPCGPVAFGAAPVFSPPVIILRDRGRFGRGHGFGFGGGFGRGFDRRGFGFGGFGRFGGGPVSRSLRLFGL